MEIMKNDKGRMKIFKERCSVLQEVLQIWKLGKTVSVSCLHDDDNTLESCPIKDTEVNIVKKQHLDFMEQDEISNENTSNEETCSNVPLAVSVESMESKIKQIEKEMGKRNLASRQNKKQGKSQQVEKKICQPRYLD